MTKRALLCLFFLALFLCTPFRAVAETASDLSVLSSAKRIFSYSGKASAYFYGFSNQTLYSARVIPSVSLRTVRTGGVIRAVCHDENSVYAMCESGKGDFSVGTLNLSNGAYAEQSLNCAKDISYTSFAVSDGEVFLLSDGVTGICGERVYQYALGDSAAQLFVNGNSAYALTDSGNIYRLFKGSAAFCTALNTHTLVTNAGDGFVLTADGILCNLNGGRQYGVAQPAVQTDSGVFSDSSAIAAAAVGEQAAVLKPDYSCVVFNFREAEGGSDSNSTATADKLTVSAGTTVKQLCNCCPELTGIFDESGQPFTAGVLKTGCSAAWNGGSGGIVVLGDVSCNGAVNGADIDAVMSHLVNCQSLLSGYALAAADLDRNGSLDNRDLVLLARLAA